MRCGSGLAVVLSLLLGSASAGAEAPRGESLPALAVEVGFGCAPRERVRLEHLADTQSLVTIPTGCPGAGDSVLLALSCAGRQCQGSAFVRSHPVARLKGTRARTRVVDLQAGAPPALKKLRVRVLGTTQVRLEEPLFVHQPLAIHVSHADQRLELHMASGGASVTRLRGTRGSVAMALQVERTRKESAHLRVLLDTGRVLLDEELPLGSVRELDCAGAGLDCQGPVRFAIGESTERSAP